MKILLLLFFHIFILFNYCIDYYLNTTGTDSTTCNTYSSPCKTIDYVMKTNVNVSGRNSVVYIDHGTYNCSILGSGSVNSYFNVTFTLSANTSSSSFSSSDINTYPVILTNTSDSNYSPFCLYSNISASFHYLMCIIGNYSSGNRYFIRSFSFVFVLFCFGFLFIYIYFCR
jgi:hypothetical protein